MIKHLLKNSFIYGGARVFATLAGVLMLPLLTTHLSPHDYGILDLLRLALTLLNLTVAFEITQSIARFMADDVKHKDKYVSTALYFSLVMYSITALILAAFGTELSQILFHQEGYEIYFYFLIPWLFSKGLHYFVLNQMRWENRSINFALLQSGTALFSLIMIFIFIGILDMGIKGAIISYISGLMIFALIGIVILIKKGSISFTFSFPLLKKMIYFSLPLVPSSAAIFAQNYIDRLMITNFLSLDDLGIYSFSFQVASLLLLVITAFSMSITPLIYAKYKELSTPKDIAHALNIFLFCVFNAALGLILFLPELFHLAIGEQFYSSYTIIPLLLINIILSGIYVFTPGLAIKKKTKYIALINIIGMIINVICNYILIPHYGLKGAALATIISALCVAILYFYTTKKYYKIPYLWKHITIGSVIFITLTLMIPLFDQLNITTIFRWNLLFKIGIYSIIITSFYALFIQTIGFKITTNTIKSLWK